MLAGAVALAAALLAPVATAQTSADIAARDQLIANQENLLNTYRCLFGVDTGVVPGGCPNPDQISPGVAPTSPTQHEVDVRDGLIQAQEALLNTYRCRFDVDTEIVPGGCTDGAPAPIAEGQGQGEDRDQGQDQGVDEAEAEAEAGVASPPSSLGLDSFYAKYLDAGGVPIVSASEVPDEALYQARSVFVEMLAERPDITGAMAKTGMRIAVMAEASVLTNLPEFEDINEAFPEVDWDERIKGGGVGPTQSRPVLAIAEENLLCYDSDVFPNEDIYVHELAHAVLDMGVEQLPWGADFRKRLEAAYREAVGSGLWKNTYAATNADEYWAEGVQSYFDLNDPPGPIHNSVNTRVELKAYDPANAALVQEVFGDITLESTCREPASIRFPYSIRGTVLDPQGQPVEGFGLWAWQGEPSNSGSAITAPDGSFHIEVPKGTFTLDLYTDLVAGCTFVGWHGPRGFTRTYGFATRIDISNKSVDGIVIRLPDDPDDLPFIEWCAPS